MTPLLWVGAAFFALMILFAIVAVALVVRAERRTKQGFRELQGGIEARIEKEKAAAASTAEEAVRRAGRDPVITSMGVNFDMGGFGER